MENMMTFDQKRQAIFQAVIKQCSGEVVTKQLTIPDNGFLRELKRFQIESRARIVLAG